MEQLKISSSQAGQDTPLVQRMNAVHAQYCTLPWRRERDNTPVLRAWQRCELAGMAASDSVQFEPVSRSLLAEIDGTHRELIARARPHIESVRNSIAATGCVAMLINQRGVVVERYGLSERTAVPLANVSRKGTNLDEQCIGSSAPSITLKDRQPSLVLGDAHFCTNLRKFFCAAAPIEGPQGQLLGALDFSSYDTLPRFDILALAEDTAAAIENSFLQPDAEHVVLRFQVMPAWIDTPRQGIVVVRSDGRITGANRIALSLLGITRQELQTNTFRDLFDRDPHRLFGHQRGGASGMVEWLTTAGLDIVGRLDCKSDATFRSGADAPASMPSVAPGTGDGNSGPRRFDDAVKLRELETSAVERALSRLGGNVSAAARLLGISRNKIYRHMAATKGRGDRKVSNSSCLL